MPYRQQAADWVEYAAALRNHSSFLHTQGQKMAWWQVLCLDVVGVFVILAAVPLWWMYTIWAAGRGANEPGNEASIVQVQLMLRPSQQQAAAKQLQIAGQQVALGGGEKVQEAVGGGIQQVEKPLMRPSGEQQQQQQEAGRVAAGRKQQRQQPQQAAGVVVTAFRKQPQQLQQPQRPVTRLEEQRSGPCPKDLPTVLGSNAASRQQQQQGPGLAPAKKLL